MSRFFIILSVLLGVSGLFADVIPIGHSRNGYPLVIPQVQSLEAVPGSFMLPEKLTVMAPETLDLAPFAKCYSETVKGGSIRQSDAGGLCRFEITPKNVPESPEGYALAVTTEGIAVTAREVCGLYYGMQTLNMMLRHRDTASMLPCCNITDWPDLRMRGLFLHLSKATSRQIDRLCHVIDMKNNVFCVNSFNKKS